MQQPTKKMISLIYVGVSAIAWLIFFNLVSFIWVTVGIGYGRTWTVPFPTLLSIAMSVVLFFALFKNQKVNEFVEQVIIELSKVAWPNRKETVLSTGIVAVLLGICSLILFFFDMFWGAMVKIFYQ